MHPHMYQEDTQGRAATNSFPRYTLAYANTKFRQKMGINHLKDKIILEMELGSFFGPATGLIEQELFLFVIFFKKK